MLPLALVRPGLHAVHPGCSVMPVKKPLGHSAQPELSSTYEPGKQSEHTVLPLVAVPRPDSHCLHSCHSVVSVIKPLGHLAQPLLSSTYEPGKQREHTVLRFGAVRPGAQASHGVERCCSAENVSSSQT